MNAPAQSLLVAVQWNDQRAARQCELSDREGFRVTMPFDPKVGQPVMAWFREAGSRGTGFQVPGVVASVYHAFEADEGHRLMIRFKPGVTSDVIDRVVAMGVRHGIADRKLLPAVATPRPVTAPLGPVAHTPQVGRDGIARAHVRGTRRIWVLERLRPNEICLAVRELLDGTFMLPEVHLAADELDQVALRLSLDGYSLLIPCEVRYQVEAGQGQPGAVLAVGRVPTVLRTRLADEARRQAAAGGQGSQASPEPAAPARGGRRLATPRPSRARDRLVSATSDAEAQPARPRMRRRKVTDPVMRISRTPLPARTVSTRPVPVQAVHEVSPAPLPGRAPQLPPLPSGTPLPGTRLPPPQAEREEAPPAGRLRRPEPAGAAPQATPAAGVRKPAARRPSGPLMERDRPPEPTPPPDEAPPAGAHRHALASAMLLGRTPAPPAERASEAVPEEETPAAGILRRRTSRAED